MADEVYNQLKLAALQRSPQLGLPTHLIGTNNLIPPSARPVILNDVHSAHRAYIASLARTGDPVPNFLRRQQPVNGLLGVEGFLMPGKLASFNTPPDSKYTGVLQFGASAFHNNAQRIATRLNDMMNDPAMRGTTLAQMIKDKKVEFPFTRDNVWAVHRHPVAQFVGAAIHTSSMHPKIDKLVQGGKINAQQGDALFVLAHNIPTLAHMVSSSLAAGADKPTNANDVAALKKYMESNPALYRDTTSLRGILDKVAAYTQQKGQGVERIASGAHPVERTPRAADAPDNQTQLTNFISGLLKEEQQKRGISEHDRRLLTQMIEEIQRNPPVATPPAPPAAAPPAVVVTVRPTPLPTPTVRSAHPAPLPPATVVADRQPVQRTRSPEAPVRAAGTLDAQRARLESGRVPLAPPAHVPSTRVAAPLTAREIDRSEAEMVRREQQRIQQAPPVRRDDVPRPPEDIPNVPGKRQKNIVTNSTRPTV